MAALLFSGRDWLWPGLGLFAFFLILLLWAYRLPDASPKIRRIAMLFKALGLALLILCLLEPFWSGQRAKPGANYFVLLADNSQGMQIRDQNASESRGELLRALVADNQSEWQVSLEEDFEVRRYLFDSKLQLTRDYSELAFDGRSTSLKHALTELSQRYQGRPVAGVLLLTDGNATDMPDGSLSLSGLPPVFPVLFGKDSPARDLSIQKISVSQTSFEDAPVTVQARISAAGYSGSRVLAALRDREGVLVAEETQEVGQSPETLNYRFQFRPKQSGLSYYQLEVEAKPPAGPNLAPEESEEATLANNRRIVVVNRGTGPYRILYVAGRPNWEFKFLNRALEEDDQIQLVALLRIAKREPKFEFRGRAGESSNPLFRGFDRKTEETERYDQPVLIRLNTRDETELRSGFPKTAEDLFGYHAVIVDDLEADFFTHEQMVLLQKFVSERGGGFLMLSGQESFHEGKYDRTPIGEMMPIYMDRPRITAQASAFQFEMAREGWLQPWVRLRSTEEAERARIEAMPTFGVLNQVRDLKPGASLLASVTDPAGNQFPALVVQRYGRGRAAGFMIGDFWRWGLRDETMQKDMAKAWRQIGRWLTTDVLERLDLQVVETHDSNQSVVLQLRARDKEFQPLENASVAVDVQAVTSASQASSPETGATPSAKPAVRMTGEPALSEPGLYEATYLPRETGAYQAKAIVTDATGLEVGRVEVGWASDPAAEEFASLRPNRELLEKIARQTGGEMIEVDGLSRFARSLPKRSVPVTEPWLKPLWHTPWVFLLALACFVTEWGLRRLKGLA